jgi:hypothetical protein
MATRPESAKPMVTRYRLQPALLTSASWKWSTGKACSTSVGEGRITDGTMSA